MSSQPPYALLRAELKLAKELNSELVAALELALKGFEAFEEAARGKSELWMPTVRAVLAKAKAQP